jgi:hypothetical protein
MERRPGSGGGPRRVSASFLNLDLLHHIHTITDHAIVVFIFSG